MYTQCPECQIAFRVTARVLQKAGGRVRCGGCGNAFSAIDHLTEGLPNPSDGAAEESKLEDKNQVLLDTLDQLAGPENVRIEDTGVEWRVLSEADDAQQANESIENAQVPLKLDQAKEPQEPSRADELRYDDNTPLPDGFEDDVPFSPPLDAPRRRTGDQDEEQTDFDTRQVDLALGEDEDWTDLLDADAETGGEDELDRQVDAAEAQQIGDDSAILPQLAEAALAGDEKHADPDAAADSARGKSGASLPDDLETQFDLQAEAMGLEITRNEDMDAEIEDGRPDNEAHKELEVPAEHSHKHVDEGDDELSPEEEAGIVEKLRASTGSFQKQIDAAQLTLETDEVEETGEGLTETGSDAKEGKSATSDNPEPDAKPASESMRERASKTPAEDSSEQHEDTGDLPRDDDLSQTMIRAGIDPSLLDNENVEAIIMEGESVDGTADGRRQETDENVIADIEQQINLVDTYMINKERLRSVRHQVGSGVIAGVVFLLALLAAQFMHASRQTFATYGAFNQTLGPVYRALGQPVTPQWNIKGWQFERTSGNTDENESVLTVFSQIKNGSDDPLPYPLLHVSLTDRWEEIIGSKILEPGDYLAGDLDPRKLVAPGDLFRAVIMIEQPSAEATGFQLYVCYRIDPGRVRCATEDFKN